MNLDALTNAAQTSYTSVENLTNTMDPNNPQDMIKLQQEMAKMQNLFGTLSAMISTIKQTGQSIIQKM